MKKFMLLIFLLYACLLHAQSPRLTSNCSKTSVGFTPINDLGTGYFRGFQGGLYPNGSNVRPATHNQAGLHLAAGITPLNKAGKKDSVNGKIVWLSIGMSNTTMESQVFISMADTFSKKNPKLVLIDGAIGGQDINIIDNPNSPYWDSVLNRLKNAGLSASQVQIVWFKEAEKRPTDTAFARYPDSLKIKYKIAIQILKTKFPNVQLCYVASRIYAGYASTIENPEPYAYYSGWSVKRMIEDQINGDTALRYRGTSPRAPWLAWGPYFWADGLIPRSDGLTWKCSDYNDDGTHPSQQGRVKVATMLLDFFSTDATTTPWFIKPSPSVHAPYASVASTDDVQNNNRNVVISPNPFIDNFKIDLGNMNVQNVVLKIFDMQQHLVTARKLTGNITMFGSELKPGIYFAEIANNDAIITRVRIIKSK